jgi:hypothetical protein
MGHLMAKEKKSMRRRLESSVGNASLLPRRRRITLMICLVSCRVLMRLGLVGLSQGDEYDFDMGLLETAISTVRESGMSRRD